jgi:RNA polymerase sporulation-specific sigma factor
MSKFSPDIMCNLSRDKNYYSLYKRDNLLRCKVDPDYLGDVMTVNENLIWHSMHKYVGKPEIVAKTNGMEKDDIHQLARLGFIKAIKAFDVDRGIKFSSFAVTAIVREVRCYIRDSASIIRLSRTAHNLLTEMRKLENDLGYLPTTEEISILLNEDESKIVKVLQVGKSIKYLDEELLYEQKYDMSCKFTDILADDSIHVENEVVDKVYISQVLRNIRIKLSDLEVSVLKGQMQGLSQTQIAKANLISHMRVSRIVKKIASLIEGYKNRTH